MLPLVSSLSTSFPINDILDTPLHLPSELSGYPGNQYRPDANLGKLQLRRESGDKFLLPNTHVAASDRGRLPIASMFIRSAASYDTGSLNRA